MLLVGEDPLRLERARAALAERGIAAATCPLDAALDTAADAPVVAILVDLSRQAERAIGVTAELGLARGDLPVAIAGVRDAEMERRVRTELPRAAFVSREPPGDPDVIEQLLRTAEP